MEKFYNTLTKLENSCKEQLNVYNYREGREYLAAIIYAKYCIKHKRKTEIEFNKGFLIATVFWFVFIVLTY